jgi:hypothetical protein
MSYSYVYFAPLDYYVLQGNGTNLHRKGDTKCINQIKNDDDGAWDWTRVYVMGSELTTHHARIYQTELLFALKKFLIFKWMHLYYNWFNFSSN